MDLILFPNQLFEIKLLKSNTPMVKTIYFIEDPVFYGDRKGSGAVENLQLNQLRIMYMYVVHQRYIKQLKEAGYKVIFKSILDLFGKTHSYSFLPKNCILYDPCDHVLMKRLESTNINWTIINNPSFLLTNQDIELYRKNKETKRFQHHDFYKFVKNKLKILENVPSQDKYNREPYKKDIPMPPNAFQHLFSNSREWESVIKWLEKTPFQNNPRPLLEWKVIIDNYLIHLPLTSADVKQWLFDFIKNRFNNYGKYQDVVTTENVLLYHSGLSIYLNNGLITPMEVIQAISKKKTDIQNYEGFVRQVIGWREYCRMYYLQVATKDFKKNIFKQPLQKKLNEAWYTGETEIPIVNETIQYAFNYGYLNHIQRLMVMANYMTLSNIHADRIYQWMYEFSLDSYEWVMVFNCYSMGSWSDGGLAMRKPYISSSNYILKMSDAKKGDWMILWNKKFQTFLKKNHTILEHTQLANLL